MDAMLSPRAAARGITTRTRRLIKLTSVRQSREEPAARYLIVRRAIGTGAHSSCDLVQRKSDELLLVIKRCRNATSEALREAKLLESLRHPNIVRIHEHFKEAAGTISLVMDYATGGDLETHLAQRSRERQPLTDG